MSRASEALAEFISAFDIGPFHPWGVLIEEEVAELREAMTAGQGAHSPTDAARELADVLYVIYGMAQALGIDLDAAFEAVHEANMAKLPTCDECGGRGWGPSYHDPETKLTTADRRRCEACTGTGKGKPIRRDDGKVLRPDGWTPPDLSAAIR